MNQAEATQCVAYLNAAFPRDALEPESFSIWVSEIMELGHAEAGLDAAKTIARNGDRFPTIKEFRQAYRGAFNRWLAGRELEPVYEVVGPSPEAYATLEQIQNGMPYGWGADGRFHSRHTPIPESTSIKARPVWARYLRRKAVKAATAGFDPVTMAPPTEAEKHDAILVLWSYLVGDAMHVEAQRIMDEASA